MAARAKSPTESEDSGWEEDKSGCGTEFRGTHRKLELGRGKSQIEENPIGIGRGRGFSSTSLKFWDPGPKPESPSDKSISSDELNIVKTMRGRGISKKPLHFELSEQTGIGEQDSSQQSDDFASGPDVGKDAVRRGGKVVVESDATSDDNFGNRFFNRKISETALSQGSIPSPSLESSEENETSALEVEPDSDSAPHDAGCNTYKLDSVVARSEAVVHGNYTFNESLFYFHQLATLNPKIAANLRSLKISDLTRCQSVCIPAVLDNRNVVLVGASSSKRTSACVIPTLSKLLDNPNEELRPGNGPRCVLLTWNSTRAVYLNRLCTHFCGHSLSTIVSFGGGLEEARQDELTNGCDILVTTPKSWLRQLRYPTVTNMTRLCYVLFDSTDILLNSFSEEVTAIMKRICLAQRIRFESNCSTKIQCMFISEKWSDELHRALLVLEDPVLCITSHLEAAIYARLSPVIRFSQTDNKIKILEEMLLARPPQKTVIMCKNMEEATKLKMALVRLNRKLLVVHEKMHGSLIKETGASWACTEDLILICTDSPLSDVAKWRPQAKWVIHFSLPESKTYFSQRFSLLTERFPDRISKPTAPPPKCLVHIFVSQSDILQIPELIHLMERLEMTVAPVLRCCVRAVLRHQEIGKEANPLCKNILQFGHCFNQVKCKSCHTLRQSDRPQDVPTEGFIKYQIVTVHSPSKYTVRPVARSLTLKESDWVKYDDDYVNCSLQLTLNLARQMKAYYERPKVGDVVGVEAEFDLQFKRARIVEITKREKLQPTEVKVEFIDEGTTDILKVHQLLELPHDLKSIPSKNLNLYLGSIMPLDMDKTWSNITTKVVYNLINKLPHPQDRPWARPVFLSKILLSINDALIVENLQYWNTFNKLNVPFIQLDIFNHLISNGYAMKNPDHLSKLYALCRDAEWNVPNSGITPCVQTPFTTAHLSFEDFLMVHVVSVSNPNNFYVIQCRYYDLTVQLEKDLAVKLDAVKTPLNCFDVGTVCAVKTTDRWNRAMIVDDYADIDINENVTVFYADYGDVSVVSKKDVFVLPSKFITRLPFQAINCSLVGIGPRESEGWDNSASTSFLSYTRTQGNIWVTLHAKAVSKKPNLSESGSARYDIVLINFEDETFNTINLVLSQNAYCDLTEDSPLITEAVTEFKQLVRIAQGETETFEEVKPELGTPEVEPLSTIDVDDLSVEEWRSLFPEVERGVDYLVNKGLAVPKQPKNKEKTIPTQRSIRIRPEPSHDSCESTDSESEFDAPDGPPPLVRLRTIVPTLVWRDDSEEVWIKVDLPHVESYSLTWTTSYLTFRTRLNSKNYWFVLYFFGPIRSIEHKLNGMYVLIQAEKQVKKILWPRLTHNKVKTHKIVLDPDHVKDTCELEGTIQFHHEKGRFLEEHGSSWRKKSRHRAGPEVSCDEDSDMEDYNPTHLDDPYNPLA